MDRDHPATSTRAQGPAGTANGTPVSWEEWRPPPPAAARSVPLTELLTIVVLTPAQAALVIADLLDAAGPTPPARVHAVVRSDGAVDLPEPPAGATAPLPASVAAPAAIPLPQVLDEVVRNARRLPAHPHPHQLVLLREVEAQAGSTGDPVARAAALRQALVEVIGPDAVTRIRREMVALLEAFGGVAISDFGSGLGSSVRINGHTVGHSATVQAAPPRQHPPTHPRTSRRRKRTRRLVAALAVLVVVLAAAGYVFTRGPGSGLLDSLRGRSHPASAQPPARSQHKAHQHATHTTPARHRHTAATLAPHAAGAVQGVVLQKTTACTPGAPCGVMVTVHLSASGASQVVGWRVGVTRGCSRRVTWSPETTVTAQPGWTHVYATSSVSLPKGSSLALVALTSAPAHAQSQPVPATGAALSC